MEQENKISNGVDEIDEILTRGVENIYPSKDALKKRMLSGKKMKIYIGVDPTSLDLHLGHGITFRKLRQFQDLGHEVILLIGDFTGMIGDPTGKSSARVQLTREQVLKNSEGYKKQLGNILDFKNKSNPAKILFNSQWSDKLTMKEIIGLMAKFTVQQMLERDMFQERIREKKPIGLHELIYPLMQGYDCVAMDVDMEMGGNDQTFNMLIGRDLMRMMKSKEKFVLATKLLTDPAGNKMGKTEGNMIILNDSADNMFGKIMNWPDTLIVLGFEICTDVKMDEIKKDNPRDAKMRLAYEIVKTYHGEKEAEKAQENFVKLFQKKEIPENIKEIKTKTGESLEDTLIKNKIIPSKSEFRRLIKAGAIDINNQTINDVNYFVKQSIVVRVGKKKFLRIVI